MSRRESLSDRSLRHLTTEKDREEVWDDDIAGFGVRVSRATGRKVFFLQYHSPEPRELPARQRKVRTLTIGEYKLEGPEQLRLAEARKRARAALGQIASGIDPHPPRAKKSDGTPAPGRARTKARSEQRDRTPEIFGTEVLQENSFGALARDWYRLHALPNLRRLRDLESILPILLEEWRSRPASSIRRSDVRDIVGPIVARGSASRAEKVRLQVSAIFNWGLRATPFLEINPAASVPPLAKPSRATGWLKEQQIVTWWSYLVGFPRFCGHLEKARYWARGVRWRRDIVGRSVRSSR